LSHNFYVYIIIILGRRSCIVNMIDHTIDWRLFARERGFGSARSSAVLSHAEFPFLRVRNTHTHTRARAEVQNNTL